MHNDRSAPLAALAWLVDSGVDTLVEDTPCAWLTPVVASEAAPPVMLAAPPRTAPKAIETRASAAAALAASADSLPALQAALATLGTPPLFADGTPDGGVMLVGDMPSAEDIAAGTLFAGSSGRLLDRMLAAIGRDRADTYLANLFYWPAPSAADAGDIAATLPFIRRHIVLARPRALLVLGGTAAAALLGVSTGIGRLRGQWVNLDIDGFAIPVMPSFAPNYLLAHPAHKALAWRDLQAFQAKLNA